MKKTSSDPAVLPASLSPVLADCGRSLINNGYEIIPLRPGDKVPIGKGWQDLPISAERIAEAHAAFGAFNIGCRTGMLVGLDIDVWVEHPKFDELRAAIEGVLGKSPLVRWGRKGCLLLYRNDSGPMKKEKIELGAFISVCEAQEEKQRERDRSQAIEVLADPGHQVVLYGVHPITGYEYAWGGEWGIATGIGPDPMAVKVADLPLVTPQAIGQALAAAAKVMGVEAPAPKPDGPIEPPTGKRVTWELLRERLSYIHPGFDGGRPEYYPPLKPGAVPFSYVSKVWLGIGLCIRDGNVPLIDGARTREEWWGLLEDWSDGTLWFERAGEQLKDLNIPEQGVRERLKGTPSSGARVNVGTIIKYAADGGCPLPPDDEPKKSPGEVFKAYERPSGKPVSRLVSRRGSELTPKKTEWAWPQRFPRAQLSLLAGHGNGGKTTVLLDMAARITRGAQWPDSSGAAKRGSVIYFSAEDATEHTLLPRFMAAGGDREKIHFVTAVAREDGNGNRTFHMQEDLRELEMKVAEIGDVELVIFDPISSYFGRTDTYRNSEVRSVLEPVAEFADRCGVTILGNTHFAKGSKATATMRILDSVAMSAVSRACYVVVEDANDKDRRLFLPAKWNLTKRQEGLAFTISEKVVTADGIIGSYVVWEGAGVSATADEALAAMDTKDRPETAVEEAMAFVREYLADGPRPTTEVEAAAKQRGMSPSTFGKAKRRLGVKYDKDGMGGEWAARLPG